MRDAAIAGGLLAVGIAAGVRPAQAAGRKIAYKPHAVNFGKVQAGTVPLPKTVTLTDTNDLAGNLSFLRTTGPFTASAYTCSSGDIPTKPNSCKVLVYFHPASSSNPKGTKVTGTLTLDDNNGKGPQVVKLQGTAIGMAGAPPSTSGFYVSKLGPDSSNTAILQYATGSKSGNVAPSATIGGSNTGIIWVDGMALDASANLYVTSLNLLMVAEFTAGSSGNVSPAATIVGANTTLNGPGGVALDSEGNIYVANADGMSINIYSVGSNGDVAPLASIVGASTGLDEPEDIVLDGADKMYVSNCGAFCGGTSSGSITIYPALGMSTGNLNESPSATIQGGSTGLDSPVGIDFDPGGNLYVTNSKATNGGSITKYSAASLIAGGNVAPAAEIAGANTELSQPYGLAVDSSGMIYAVNNFSQTVTVYAAGSNGDVAPIVYLAGPNTGLNGGPDAIALLP
jgi:sugar lactone lactonase YvrE